MIRKPFVLAAAAAAAVGMHALAAASDQETVVKAMAKPKRGPTPAELEAHAKRLAAAQKRRDQARAVEGEIAQEAIDRRQAKARKHMTQVLAGGFGRAAQIEAWDRVFPHWRGVAEVMKRGGPYAPEDKALLGEAQALLRANGNFLGAPWPAFLDRYEGGE